MSSILISCDTCIMRATAACADCMMSHLLSPAPIEDLVFDDDEMRVVKLLARAGMVPTLRHREVDFPAAGR